MPQTPLTELEKEIDHHFKDQDLIRKALTHSSTGNEKNYERLEFLGDRVLGLIIAELLFKKFPKEAEGDLAKRLAALVQGSLIAEVAQDINLGRYIDFSEAEKEAGGAGNENILADVFEAMLGALYLDSGFEKCNELVQKLWEDRLYEMKTPPLHPKTAVQEWAQSKGLPLPHYEISSQDGPDHAPIFQIKLSVEGYEDAIAEGRSRQAAEKEAASLFLKNLEGKKS